jgi:hypothetical protein
MRVLCQNLIHGDWPGVLSLLGCSAVLADQAAEDLPSLDRGSQIGGSAGRLGSFLPQALMRPVLGKVVTGELGQDLAEMLLAVEQDVVQALAAERPHVPLGK